MYVLGQPAMKSALVDGGVDAAFRFTPVNRIFGMVYIEVSDGRHLRAINCVDSKK